MTQRPHWSHVLASVVLAGCSIVLAIAVLRPEPSPFDQNPRYGSERPSWGEFTAGDHILGNSDAPHTLVLFTDYECALCLAYDGVLRSVLSEAGDSLRIVVRVFPLHLIHQNAYQLALAAACGGSVGSFAKVHAGLVNRIDSIGTLPHWSEFADQVGLEAPEEFVNCIDERLEYASVAEDIRMSYFLALRLIPTVYLDNSRLGFAPSAETILSRMRTSAE